MDKQLKEVIASSQILAFTEKKYGRDGDTKKVMVTDPYYRFGRIIEETRPLIGQAGGKWLDLGCHHGQFLELAGKLLHYETIGMDDWDLKKDMPFTEFDYYKADLADSSWTNLIGTESVNVISALEVIEHMIDTEKFLADCRGRLSGKGFLILSTPNINCLRNRLLVPLGKYPAYMEYTNIIHHVRLFNVSVLKDLLQKNGYEVKKVSAVSFLPETLLKYSFFEKISKALARMLPGLCGNLIVIARKTD